MYDSQHFLSGFDLLTAVFLFSLLLARWHRGRCPPPYGRRKDLPELTYGRRFAKKPDWVPKEIIRMKALMPDAECRAIAHSFNRRFRHRGTTVSKSYVHEAVRKRLYEIQVLRKRIKHRRPKAVPPNWVWAVDLTGKKDTAAHVHNILGLLDHGSRTSLCLRAIQDKTSITLLRHILDTVEKYGKPKYLRSDNEAIFTSRLFRLGLWVLGIRHQRIDKGCPWMNGRIERFFGTLKSRLNHWEVDSLEQLDKALAPFRFWYNHVQPHYYLDGFTPAEVWAGADAFSSRTEEHRFEAWDGLLTGYYLRCGVFQDSCRPFHF